MTVPVSVGVNALLNNTDLHIFIIIGGFVKYVLELI